MAMTMTMQEALIEVRKGLRVFKAFEKIDQAGSAIEGMLQNKVELQAEIDRIRKAHDATVAACEAEIKAQAERLDKAKLAAAHAESQAGLEAATIISRAKAAAEARLTEATSGVAKAEAARDEAQAQALMAEAARDKAKAELEDIDARRKEAAARVTDLLAKIGG